MKAVILSGGQGTRLRPLTYSIPKQLIPVGGRPVLERVLSDIAASGIRETAIVTSPEALDAVANMLTQGGAHDLNVTLLVQPQPNGLAAAFALALPFIGNDSSLLYLGDCLITGGIRRFLEQHRGSSADATLLVKEVADPSRYGIVQLGPGEDVIRLVEKPSEPSGNLAIVGVYAFGPKIVDAVRTVEPSWRGEYEITDAIQRIVDSGGVVRTSKLDGFWIDTGTIEDVFAANSFLLESLAHSVAGDIEESRVTSPVRVAETAVVKRSHLLGPTIIGEHAVVEDSVVGPGTTVGAGTVLAASRVADSILMEDSRIEGANLGHSVLGPRVVYVGDGSQSVTSAVVGADSVVKSGSANHSG